MMKINYQVMTEDMKNENGKYIPNWKELKAKVTSADEFNYIVECEQRFKDWEDDEFMKDCIGFIFNMVYITQQKCGHYEMFQIPMNENFILEEKLEQAKEYAYKSLCTHCSCRTI
ncbi:hypothetical protein [Clostridium sp.]|uniref:hypothetical protein n=1 Tax=Clostridium sp. TaxID=1506 RepID=UPI001A52DED2|nr:hypothetical protein [Clostridium sp.]MBK5234027.1 hypothetical protein [Clostridium sp.]